MRLRHVEIFHAVMQSGSVHGAARLLHLTQPAASRLLQQAERQVGFALFQRVRGRLVPTPEAERLFPEVQRVFQSLDSVRRMAASLQDGNEEALIRLVCVPSLALEYIPRTLGPWCEQHPTARISLHTLHSQQVAQSLLMGEADVGFVFEPSGHPGLQCTPIATAPLVCVGKDLPDSSMTLQHLADHEVIGLKPGNSVGALLQAACEAQGVQLTGRLAVHSYHTAIELAAQGLGWALVDRFSATYAKKHPQLQLRTIEPEIPVTVYSLRARDRVPSLPVEKLIEAFQAALLSSVQ